MGAKPLFATQYPELRVGKLTPGYTYVVQEPEFNPKDPNSALHMSFQIGEDTVDTHAVLETIAHIAQESCYDQLRTKEQLGLKIWEARVYR